MVKEDIDDSYYLTPFTNESEKTSPNKNSQTISVAKTACHLPLVVKRSSSLNVPLAQTSNLSSKNSSSSLNSPILKSKVLSSRHKDDNLLSLIYDVFKTPSEDKQENASTTGVRRCISEVKKSHQKRGKQNCSDIDNGMLTIGISLLIAL